MRVNSITIQNVRSFLEPATFRLDGPMSIVIGPNGGGKTNLLDTLFLTLRRHIFASMYARLEPTPENAGRHVFQYNDMLSNIRLEPHSMSPQGSEQAVALELEVTETDLINMRAMQSDAPDLLRFAQGRYDNSQLEIVSEWRINEIVAGTRFTYHVVNNQLRPADSQPAAWFLQYLQRFEVDALLRELTGNGRLSIPLLYLPVNRSRHDFQSGVELANHNNYETKRTVDVGSSRMAVNIVSLAIGTLAAKYRLLREDDNVGAKSAFYSDPQVEELTRILSELGYEWELRCTNPMSNRYDVQLTKQGSSFLIGAASSGERELLTYLFSIFALNVRDALVVIDEPELHLHPKWQRMLLGVFERLARETGNQFLLATHSPTFVSPDSIQYVSRVYSDAQRSRIIRLNTQNLPNAKHLLNIVNSQNNERLFFADSVVLCEGISDRIVLESILDRFGRSATAGKIIEVISAGGKGSFRFYKMILDASKIPYSIVADRDYVEQIGDEKVKSLFLLNTDEIKRNVVEDVSSRDGARLVQDIEDAITSGSWDAARATWEYIKSRRRLMPSALSAEQQTIFDTFLSQQRAEGVYILRRGALEQYLPEGFAGKDVEKLIQLLEATDFWERLPTPGRDELQWIARDILDAFEGRNGGQSAISDLTIA
ncbi:chromosome segregation protein SMC [Lysobacter sp. TY2-98]|uniref:AAA family ATPase n=1 Tax=Lysobacter sp. TY2-98 TaxID=2290922 RepID=UPI000E20ACC0|nr:AAA family ATPase [Lysobacter sp. TY2-98]AXK72880.1 chromosome segregation protein SMC [Lysobacter sp. TY2-98]